LRAFLTSVLIKPGKQHKIVSLFRPAPGPAKNGPAVTSATPK
jgi:hypothetical protein